MGDRSTNHIDPLTDPHTPARSVLPLLCRCGMAPADLRDEWLSVSALAVVAEVMEAQADDDDIIAVCCNAVYRLVDGSGAL